MENGEDAEKKVLEGGEEWIEVFGKHIYTGVPPAAAHIYTHTARQ